jgi:hypothetical protein
MQISLDFILHLFTPVLNSEMNSVLKKYFSIKSPLLYIVYKIAYAFHVSFKKNDPLNIVMF